MVQVLHSFLAGAPFIVSAIVGAAPTIRGGVKVRKWIAPSTRSGEYSDAVQKRSGFGIDKERSCAAHVNSFFSRTNLHHWTNLQMVYSINASYVSTFIGMG